ncbi:ABC transporter ATP-binding protein [Alienimonas californiensis]|uniref:Putative ABC transporter ATP-binding protein YbhF n=1 Tax=Alienimonas californiensis TaxID=2527989 RepID=A0A517PED5_9PLAN|nr:ABC transporter ATP-binding protein [Alienimonas californiensis]QDT17732.1 putative ABC transporter ATP-binding protein YbhF [Alienimonas californiensis]
MNTAVLGANAAGGPPPSLEVRSLTRRFGKLKAVDEVSFLARPGQVIGFIGPNGAGKTTTMRILATLDTPTEGDAFVCGHSVIDDADAVRDKLGFMPDGFGKYPNMSVVEYLDFFARAYGLTGAARRDAVERVLVFTELRRIAHKSVTELSKGMGQRLGLGRTLVHDPEVLILDEPAAGLDPRARVELRELIALLARDLNKTVLISSHILTELGEICDAAAIIEAGKIIVSGTVDEIRAARRTRAAEKAAGGVGMGAALAVRTLGDPTAAVRWLLEQPGVTDASEAGWAVGFTFDGEDAERAALLRNMLAAGFEVTEFAAETESLEDAFMALTEGITQ